MTYYKYDTHTQNAKARFDTKYTIQQDGCWSWNPYRDSDGYGSFTININKHKYTLRAHRYSWVIANQQDWPADKPVARHTCNNPCCVNPDHIVPGTVSENTFDSIRAGTYVNATKRPVSTPIGDFDSGVAAAQALNIRPSHLCKLLKDGAPGYAYIQSA